MLDDILLFAHNLLAKHIAPGDTVLDGTAGNGHDTLFLAQCVGQGGRVFALDIQPAALAATRTRVAAAGLSDVLELIEDSHANVADYVLPPISAAVFNFGYLPHGDKTITTQPETSVAAVSASLDLLKTNGVLVAVIYAGHETGAREKAALLDFFAALPPKAYAVVQYAILNRHNVPPCVVAVVKK